VRRGLAALAAFTILSTSSGFAQESSCQVIRAEGASLLRECGDTLHSFSLLTSDMRGRVAQDMHGRRFYFACRLTPDSDLLDSLRDRKSGDPNYNCNAEPSISGFFFDSTYWRSSRRDEQAILATLIQHPHNSGILNDKESSALKVNCAVFDASVGDLPAKAVCFSRSNESADAIAVVAADDGIGLVLIFSQKDQSAEAFRNRVQEMLSSFSVKRGTGDAALLRWVQ
jgi:hypothetical protein